MAQIGTNGDDTEFFFNNDDPVIYALDGNDVVKYTGLGNAYIEGGRGDDELWAGINWATIYGGDGNDLIRGSYNPEVDGSMNIDHLYGGNGNDVIYSGGGNDRMFGDEGDDILYGPGTGTMEAPNTAYLDGGAGNDILYGGSGYGAELHGGDGNDIFYMQNARIAFGGDGDDIYEVVRSDAFIYEARRSFTGAASQDLVFAYVDYTLPDHVENLVMLYGVQTFGLGNGNHNIIIGNAQGNVIEGMDGYDTLTGGDGSDLFVINAGWEVDVITDFVAGTGTEDAIVFNMAVFADFADVMAHTRQVGADTWIEDGNGNTVVLSNTAMESLAADDFQFFG